MGSVLRYLLGSAVNETAHSDFPFGTLAVNIIGCFLIGVIFRAILNMQTYDHLRALLIVGFCGGFTTFSSFSIEALLLVQGGRLGYAALYIGTSVMICLLATAGGMATARAFSP